MLKSLDDPKTAGLILEEQANALKSILGDPSVLKLVRVNVTFSFCLCYMVYCKENYKFDLVVKWLKQGLKCQLVRVE